MNLIHTVNTYKKNPLIIGTALLTAAGVLSRIIGFFYRIFLSRTIGAESLGLYQLSFPVLALCLTLTSSGIQTALSRFVAEEKEHPDHARQYFHISLLLSCGLCIITGAFVSHHAKWIAFHLLGDSRCESLLVVMTYCFIPACIHACINGYYYGMKKADIPAISQLVEQAARVGGVYIMYIILAENNSSIHSLHAMWGVAIGEIAGMLYSVTAMWIHNLRDTASGSSGIIFSKSSPSFDKKKITHTKTTSLSYRHAMYLLVGMAIPLTFNRVLINLCTSIENLLIPQRLCMYGLSQSEALSVYGVLSGMAISIIFFPNVLTGSLSVLLLPAVSEANAAGHEHSIILATQKAVRYGLLIGFGFTFIFFIFGHYIGITIFDSALAGQFIRQLSWLCPCMYVSGMLSSILHGLGRPKTVLLINLLSCLMRITFVWFLVPRYGIDAYLWSMLISQFFCAVASMVSLRRYLI